MPINTTSLAHYFAGACILPSSYYTNKPEDIQDMFKGLLLLTTHIGTKQTNCCMEIVLDEEEIKELIDVNNGFYLYEKPLPISRVKQVIFSNRDQLDTTITNIRLSTAFVPDNIVSLVNEFESVDVNDVVCPSDIVIQDISSKQKDFDRILGGLAVMKCAHSDYMNYSEHYFSTLSYFNDVIRTELINSKLQIDEDYQPILVNEQNKLHKYLYEPISDKLVEKVAAEEHQIVQKNKVTKVISLDTLDKKTYIIAVLNTYGSGNESKIKNVDTLFLSNFSKGIRQGKEEGIALCYGISRGYSSLRNFYKNNDIEVDVKYRLESLLDYYTIESVYQYVYYGRKTGEFPILNWVKPKNPKKPIRDTDYIVIDEYVIGKKKPRVSTLEYLKKLLARFFQNATSEYFEQFITIIRDIVYEDTKKEIEEEQIEKIRNYEVKMSETKAQHAKEVAELKIVQQAEIESLRCQLEEQKLKQNSEPLMKKYDEYGLKQGKSDETTNGSEHIDKNIHKEQIIREAISLSKTNKSVLKAKGQKQGVIFNSKDTIEDMVVKIMCGQVEKLKIFQ